MKKEIGANPSEEAAKGPNSDPTIHGLFKLVETLSQQLVDMNENLPKKVAMGLDALIDSRIEVRFQPVHKRLEEKIGTLEDEIRRLQEQLRSDETKEPACSDAHSQEKTMSQEFDWLVMESKKQPNKKVGGKKPVIEETKPKIGQPEQGRNQN